MIAASRLNSPGAFSSALFEIMKDLNPGIADLDLNEFRYALENLLPEHGWDSVQMESRETIEQLISQRDFYESIQLKPRQDDRIILDRRVAELTRLLFSGLVEGEYSTQWVGRHFYFDVRGFIFMPRTIYFTAEVLAHFGGQPYKSFSKKQQLFDRFQGIGYKDFMQANAEIDQALIESLKSIVALRGTPVLVTLAGPTAAGKTEITERLLAEFGNIGQRITTIEADNFLLDRDLRENQPMGKGSTHFSLFISCLEEILKGQKVRIPRYDFINATSSHDPAGNLRLGRVPLEVEPSDIIFLEGNFPFHLDEIARLVGIKIVYLTDDPIRLKRKWKRDIDYRKKYDPAYFRNRFFRTQFLRADEIYRPMMRVCDLIVDTTNADLWATPEIALLLAGNRDR